MAHFDLIYPERFGRPQIASFSGSIGMALPSGETKLECADDIQIYLFQVRIQYYKFITLIGDSEKISLIDWFTVFHFCYCVQKGNSCS